MSGINIRKGEGLRSALTNIIEGTKVDKGANFGISQIKIEGDKTTRD
jgi:hypothetical protein